MGLGAREVGCATESHPQSLRPPTFHPSTPPARKAELRAANVRIASRTSSCAHCRHSSALSPPSRVPPWLSFLRCAAPVAMLTRAPAHPPYLLVLYRSATLALSTPPAPSAPTTPHPTPPLILTPLRWATLASCCCEAPDPTPSLLPPLPALVYRPSGSITSLCVTPCQPPSPLYFILQVGESGFLLLRRMGSNAPAPLPLFCVDPAPRLLPYE